MHPLDPHRAAKLLLHHHGREAKAHAMQGVVTMAEAGGQGWPCRSGGRFRHGMTSKMMRTALRLPTRNEPREGVPARWGAGAPRDAERM